MHRASHWYLFHVCVRILRRKDLDSQYKHSTSARYYSRVFGSSEGKQRALDSTSLLTEVMRSSNYQCFVISSCLIPRFEIAYQGQQVNINRETAVNWPRKNVTALLFSHISPVSTTRNHREKKMWSIADLIETGYEKILSKGKADEKVKKKSLVSLFQVGRNVVHLTWLLVPRVSDRLY